MSYVITHIQDTNSRTIWTDIDSERDFVAIFDLTPIIFDLTPIFWGILWTEYILRYREIYFGLISDYFTCATHAYDSHAYDSHEATYYFFS